MRNFIAGEKEAWKRSAQVKAVEQWINQIEEADTLASSDVLADGMT